MTAPPPADPLAALRLVLADLLPGGPSAPPPHPNAPEVRQLARWVRYLLPALRQVPPARRRFAILLTWADGELQEPLLLARWDGETEGS